MDVGQGSKGHSVCEGLTQKTSNVMSAEGASLTQQ